jgi:hypothetical protein
MRIRCLSGDVSLPWEKEAALKTILSADTGPLDPLYNGGVLPIGAATVVRLEKAWGK